MRLSDEEFEVVVEDAIASIPEGFDRYIEDLAVDIEDSPDEATCRELRLRDPRGLLGLYRGTPLTQRHVERICRTRDQMVDQIRKTVLHEIGHHFGLSERQLRELGYG